MATTNFHGAVGAKICALIPSPLGVILAFLSHFPCDFFPDAWKKLTPLYYAGQAVIFILLVSKISTLWMILGAIAANLPDLIDTVYFKLFKKRIFPCHPKPRLIDFGFEFQRTALPMTINLAIDAVVVLLLL